MPTPRSHGFPYQQPERHNELSSGEPAPPQAEARGERRANGTWTKGARTAQSKGGKAIAGRGRALVHHGAASKGARALRRALRGEIAALVGGGVCGVAASLMVRWAADKTELAERAKAAGDLETFRKLTESARMDLLYAREHAAKEAAARPKRETVLPSFLQGIDVAAPSAPAKPPNEFLALQVSAEPKETKR